MLMFTCLICNWKKKVKQICVCVRVWVLLCFLTGCINVLSMVSCKIIPDEYAEKGGGRERERSDKKYLVLIHVFISSVFTFVPIYRKNFHLLLPFWFASPLINFFCPQKGRENPTFNELSWQAIITPLLWVTKIFLSVMCLYYCF